MAPSEAVQNTIREFLKMGVTLHAIAHDAGIPVQSLARFMHHEQTLSVLELGQLKDTLQVKNKLCRSFGLRLVGKAAKGRSGKRAAPRRAP